MVREDADGITHIWDNSINQCKGYIVKETPEEILAMPDIEEGNKVIDWEQRRYESTLLKYNQIVAAADALIRELKK